MPHISDFTVSLNVDDPNASADFLGTHFGFDRLLDVEGAISLAVPGSNFSVCFLQTGLPSFKPASQAMSAKGLLVVFTVDDIDSLYDALVAAGVDVVTPIETEPWLERYFQVSDPNGVIVQAVQWVTEDGQLPQFAGPTES